MLKQYLFLAHGMGVHATGAWAEEFETSILRALKNYKPFKGRSDDDIKSKWIEFVPLHYDDQIDGFRKRWKKLADDTKGPLAKEWPQGKRIFDFLSKSATDKGVAKGIFWSHLLDPLLWYTLPDARKSVIALANEQICAGLEKMYDEVKTNTSHIIAHSLGTSVVHDCVTALRFAPEVFPAFDTGAHRWKTVVTLANVSRLLKPIFKVDAKRSASAFDPYESPFRAGFADATCDNFINAHHRIDPFTWPMQFRPTWPPQAYTDIETIEFKEPDTVHDFDVYFENPRVHVPVIWAMFGDFDMCTPPEVAAATGKYDAEHPFHASAELEHLRGLFGADSNAELDAKRLAEYLYNAYVELTS